MVYKATVYNVMISSPSDILEERDAAQKAIYRWNSVHSENRQIVLLPIEWESHSTPETGDRPQNIINRQILKRSDLLIGLFWVRMGTPTEEFISGSAEEVSKHVSAGKPTMLYFSDQLMRPSSFDQEQYNKLQEFKEQWKSQALLGNWNDLSEFNDKFYQHLERTINNHPYFQKTLVAESRPTPSIVAESQSTPSALEYSLSNEARSLLVMAAQGNTTIQYEDGISGEMIEAGGKKVVETVDFHSIIIFKGAIDELKTKELIEDKPGFMRTNPKIFSKEIYRITVKGLQVYNILMYRLS